MFIFLYSCLNCVLTIFNFVDRPQYAYTVSWFQWQCLLQYLIFSTMLHFTIFVFLPLFPFYCLQR